MASVSQTHRKGAQLNLKKKPAAALLAVKNVDVQKVTDTLVAAAKTKLDQAVADGRLTQQQATRKKAEITERVSEMVNRVRPERNHRGDRLGVTTSTTQAPAVS